MPRTEKNITRERVLNLLKNQGEGEQIEKSFVIAEKLFAMREFKEAETILFYASFNGEVNTFKMIKEAQQLNKTIALPAINKKDNTITPRLVESLEELTKGSFGIIEPPKSSRELKPEDLDLVIVPGVAFDKKGNRLGRGAGHYDRFLDKLPKDTPSVGLAFDFQIVDQLPHQEQHDRPVKCVLTN